ncbi:MAG: anti-sigma factor family protein [Flavipsychrobacter sp.]
MVTLENYEEYVIRHVDNELNAAELQELEAFMTLHPELRSEMTLYENTRLAPDTTVIFEHKEQLLKKLGSYIISLRNWRTYGAAAGIVALIGTAILFLQRSNNHVTTVVNVTVNKNTYSQPLNNPVTNVTSIKNDTTAQKPIAVMIKKQEPTIQQAPISTRHNNPVIATTEKNIQDQQTDASNISPITIARANTLPVLNNHEPSKIKQVQVTIPTITDNTITEDIEDKEPFAWLPIDESKKQGLKDLKNTVDEKVKEVRSITNNLKETAFVFKLGKKEITLNF